MKLTSLVLLLALMCLSSIARADSPKRCARMYAENLKNEGSSLGFAPSDAEAMVAEVARSIAFQQSIKVIYCDYVTKALAWPAKGEDGIPDGDFIEVNPIWFQEVIGNDRVQAIALLGHELGHYLGRHFESRSGIPGIQKETEADGFAGCAVARLSGDWTTLENLLSRIRSVDGGNGYPTRTQSLDAARHGFDDCGGSKPRPLSSRAALRVAAVPDTVSIPINGFSAVDYPFKETKGIDVQIDSEDTQWFLINGEPLTPISRNQRILGGSFPVSGSSSETYHNNIYLPPNIAALAKAKGQNVVQLKHTFNCRDQNDNLSQVSAILKIYIQ
ncbi:hypothetical protein P9250_19730 [Caballeronia sp. LP006]|uniref:hypothetical protein n=1 Tax=Caballeronia sp. LP006 TaxID=3038552 RepID=UPI0028607C88|nr:hypothetical protein [Caballeronia sp. LP006]MDR5830107.1 hypothetical protein [Caballeronia sp. LP006]